MDSYSYNRGFEDGYRAGMRHATLVAQIPVAPQVTSDSTPAVAPTRPKKRKVSAYNKRYSAAYKKLRRKATLKNGTLRKGVTHKKLVKAAHKEAKKGGKK